MEREQLRELAAALVLEPLVGLADLRMELAASLVREPFVGRVAEERVAEAEGAGRVRVALDELVQPVPRLRVCRGLGIVREHLADELGAEACAEHGGVAQQRAVARLELVDAGRHDGLDALGERLVLGRARGGDELLQEERVAAGAAGDRGRLVLQQALSGGSADQLLRGRLVEAAGAGSSSPGSAARRLPPRSRRRPAAGSRTAATAGPRPGRRGAAGARPTPRPSSARPRSRAASGLRAASPAPTRPRRAGAPGGRPAAAPRPPASARPARPAAAPRAAARGRARGRAPSTRSRSASGAAPFCGSSSSERSRPRKAKYGVEASYCAHAVVTESRSGACACSSSTSRDLPMPGSPISSTMFPKPIRTGASAAERIVSSRSRPTKGSRRSGSAPAPATPTTSNAVTGLGDPLQGQRLQLDRLEGAARALEQVGGRQHLARLGLPHQASREGGRLAEDRVRAPELGADLTREDAAARGAEPQRQLGREVGDPARAFAGFAPRPRPRSPGRRRRG